MLFKIKSLKGIKNFFGNIKNLERDGEVIIDYYYFQVSKKEIKKFILEVENISEGECQKETAFKMLESMLQFIHAQFKKQKQKKSNRFYALNPQKWEQMLKNYKRHTETQYDDMIRACYFLKKERLLEKKEVTQKLLELKNINVKYLQRLCLTTP